MFVAGPAPRFPYYPAVSRGGFEPFRPCRAVGIDFLLY